MDYAMLASAVLAVIVFLVGQTFLRFTIDPCMKLRELISTIDSKLTYYGRDYANPIRLQADTKTDVLNATQADLRVLASDLRAAPRRALFYTLVRHLFGLPSQHATRQASGDLLDISNGLWTTGDFVIDLAVSNIEKSKSVRKRLGIPDEVR